MLIVFQYSNIYYLGMGHNSHILHKPNLDSKEHKQFDFVEMCLQLAPL